jgi:hypothetical protein
MLGEKLECTGKCIGCGIRSSRKECAMIKFSLVVYLAPIQNTHPICAITSSSGSLSSPSAFIFSLTVFELISIDRVIFVSAY